MAITIQDMTTKERLHKLVDELTEQEADETLQFAAARHQVADADEWGDLDAMLDEEADDTMRMLEEEEAAAGFSWEQRGPS